MIHEHALTPGTAALPRTAEKFFGPQRHSVRLAREFAVTVLGDWEVADRADDVRLCVSELAANALAHGTRRGHGFLVRVSARDGFVRVEVHDSRVRAGERGPEIRHPSETDVRGRGLLIVEAVTDGWGVEDREPFGKVVWARFEGRSCPAADPTASTGAGGGVR